MKNRMNWLSFTALCLMIACLIQSGCGGDSSEDVKDDTGDSTAYAADVKNTVVEVLTRAKQDGPETAEELTEFFEDLDSQPTGSNLETYKKLQTGAKELASMQAKSADFTKKIDELIELAKSLPGELQLSDEEMERDVDDDDDE